MAVSLGNSYALNLKQLYVTWWPFWFQVVAVVTN